MKKLLILLLLASSFAFAEEVTTKALRVPIVKVIDGDTIETVLKGLPEPINKFKIRVYGIDTPEKGGRAQCSKEAEMGAQATEFTKQFVGTFQTMVITKCKHDKYGGRLDCDVAVNGKDLKTEIIKAGLAREYFGEKKQSWCE